MPVLKAFIVRTGRIVIGMVLLVVSIIGFITPFLPGLPFLVAAVMFLCPDSRFALWVRTLKRGTFINNKKRQPRSGSGPYLQETR